MPTQAEPAQRARDATVDPAGVGGSAFGRYRHAAAAGNQQLAATAGVDSRLAAVLAGAAADHGHAQRATRVILDAARADAAPAADTPMGARELVARRAARARAAHYVLAHAHGRAQRHLALMRALGYGNGGGLKLPGAPNTRAAAAVRHALSKVGCPYVWGATGPRSFDCSGLIQYAYREAGVSLPRTTYAMLNTGAAVPRSMAAPGDLVFPSAGHVQMYIGNGKVVEAPHSGANVQISNMGSNVHIRRPHG